MYDKAIARLEAKIDALLNKAGIDSATIQAAPPAPRARRVLTPAEQQAIDNAPVVATVPPDAVGMVTIETKTPGVAENVRTMPAAKAKGK